MRVCQEISGVRSERSSRHIDRTMVHSVAARVGGVLPKYEYNLWYAEETTSCLTDVACPQIL